MIGAKTLKIYCNTVNRERKIRDRERIELLEDAKRYFNELGLTSIGSIEDYRKCLYYHRFSFREYMKYNLASLTKEQRNNVISCFEMNSIYRKFVPDSVRKVYADKVLCLQLFDKWVHRRWCLVKETTFEDFVGLLSSTDCIAKPVNGECGRGIFKIKKEDILNHDMLYQQCQKDDVLIEECVYACDEIEQFHPNSLNTIRVVTMSNGKECIIIGAALRIGAGGSIIDNVAQGGLTVPICLKTGILHEYATDARGFTYEKHPDTNVTFMGIQIPNWDKVINMCKDASSIVKGAVFTGWDICVRPSGEIELIEANAMPDIGVIQFAPDFLKKDIIKKSGKELLNINLLKLTSIWSRSYRKTD